MWLKLVQSWQRGRKRKQQTGWSGHACNFSSWVAPVDESQVEISQDLVIKLLSKPQRIPPPTQNLLLIKVIL